MSAYIGKKVTFRLIGENEKLQGCLISHDTINNKITVAKVVCLSSDKRLPGNQVFFMDDIIPGSLMIQDEYDNVSGVTLEKKKSKTIEQRGGKVYAGKNIRNCGFFEREKVDLDLAFKLIRSDEEAYSELLGTSCNYEQRFELVPREEWLNQIPGVRATSYLVINDLGKTFDEAIYRIKREKDIGVAAAGDISRNGKLCWLQVATSDIVYLFHTSVMGHKCINYGLGDILEAHAIVKVMHDSRFLSDLLFHQFRVKLQNVFDTQVAAIIVFRAKHGGDLPCYVTSYQQLIEEYLPRVVDEYNVLRLRRAFLKEDGEIWANCQDYPYLLDNLAKQASYLVELKQPLLDDIMEDFYIGVDSYVSMLRDVPDDKYEQVVMDSEAHSRVPNVFTNMQKRDARNRISERCFGEENRVDSVTGFVENTVQLKRDEGYRKDAIWKGSQNVTAQHGAPNTSVRRPNPSYFEVLTPGKATAINAAAKRTAELEKSAASAPLLTDAYSSPVSASIKPSRTSSTSVGIACPANNATPTSDRSEDTVRTVSSSPEDICMRGLPKPKPQLLSPMRPGFINNRPVSIGRSRWKEFIDPGLRDSSEDEVFIPRPSRRTNPGESQLAVFSSSGKTNDSGSGEDSGSNRWTSLNNGVTAGFQNVELMGNQIDLDKLPKDFDFRSANHDDLLNLHARQFGSLQLKDALPTCISVVRHELCENGSIVDLDSGVELQPLKEPAVSGSEDDVLTSGYGRGVTCRSILSSATESMRLPRSSSIVAGASQKKSNPVSKQISSLANSSLSTAQNSAQCQLVDSTQYDSDEWDD